MSEDGQLKSSTEVAEIWESDDHPPAYSEGPDNCLTWTVYLLHRLIEDDVIEKLIGVIFQSRVDILMRNAESFFNAPVYCGFVDFNPVALNIPLLYEIFQKYALTTSEIEHLAPRCNDRGNDSMV